MDLSRQQFLTGALASVGSLLLPRIGRSATLSPMRALFVNPGRSNEDFWVSVSAVMRAAAADLDIHLDVVYGERSVLYTEQVAFERIAAAEPGDYLLVGNEQHSAGPILEAGLARGLKCLIVFNGFVGEEAERYGRPREKTPNFLGELLADNVAAGAAIAQGLVAAARRAGAPLRLVGINGNTETPAAADREVGLRRTVAGTEGLHCAQVLTSDWTREEGRQRALGLLDRYPDTTIMWCANDPIALGAIDAAVQRGRQPGKDIFIGGLNWSTEAISAIRNGLLELTVGGHFLLGGWALVLLRDYHEGVDFAPLTQSTPFGTLDRANLDNWLRRFKGADWSAIRFRRFSHYLTGARGPYDFSLPTVLG
ncbi:sugar ABC transporter substrate-binding protein [Aliidongia dinghuensis]|uniref:Sugar ABC transporter substrate-binding protein n=1 Tax=Aliidongia dinghuensis TaxID=1867774 RepID=A0A8J2YVS5_9PROT|nr:ABC transporter substrate-binding protein [Aliidongia dinghuensis]GGF22921.1 sugar ABC transporter substrate-binding protein [Aliidongia dinghuensis]